MLFVLAMAVKSALMVTPLLAVVTVDVSLSIEPPLKLSEPVPSELARSMNRVPELITVPPVKLFVPRSLRF